MNDPQKAGLYMDTRFNYDLFRESQQYVAFFLEEDRSQITDPVDQQKGDALLQKVEAMDAEVAGHLGVQKIRSEQQEMFMTYAQEVQTEVVDITKKYSLPNGDNLLLIVEDLQNSSLSSNFIGVDGYKNALTDYRIGIALINTIVFTVVSVFMELILGLGLALIMNRAIRGRGFAGFTINWTGCDAVCDFRGCVEDDTVYGLIAFSRLANDPDLTQ